MKKKKYHPFKIALLLFTFFITFSLCYIFKDTALWYLAHANITFLEGTLINRPFGTLPYKVIEREGYIGAITDPQLTILHNQENLDQFFSKLPLHSDDFKNKLRTIDLNKYVIVIIYADTGFGDPLSIESITTSKATINIHERSIRYPFIHRLFSRAYPAILGGLGSIVITIEKKYIPPSLSNWELYTTDTRVPSKEKAKKQRLLDSVEYAPMR